MTARGGNFYTRPTIELMFGVNGVQVLHCSKAYEGDHGARRPKRGKFFGLRFTRKAARQVEFRIMSDKFQNLSKNHSNHCRNRVLN